MSMRNNCDNKEILNSLSFLSVLILYFLFSLSISYFQYHAVMCIYAVHGFSFTTPPQSFIQSLSQLNINYTESVLQAGCSGTMERS